MSEWISVEDRLPEEYERVLSVQEDSVVRINRVEDGDFPRIRNRYCSTVRTTHRMPLPEPPKEGTT